MKVTEQQLRANNQTFDDVIRLFELKNDAAMGRFLGMTPVNISKIRHGTLNIGSTVIIRIHEATEWPIAMIKAKLNA